ncbi:MAG: hypothetical protein QM576_13630 [Rhodopseudomonas sp.]|uniref:hypothetical protein n=1 Tax=Rhodopseudomonas sp. TaxID=1078 RepID=UPI0039E24511
MPALAAGIDVSRGCQMGARPDFRPRRSADGVRKLNIQFPKIMFSSGSITSPDWSEIARFDGKIGYAAW